ncbi:MAG: peptidoglycan-binding domain-containing protein [Pseudomonadota bacterium]
MATAPTPKPEAIKEPARQAPPPELPTVAETTPAEAATQPAIRPGECWVQAVINPKPVQKPLEIVVRDAVNDIEVTPAMLEPARKEIIVREGGITYRIEPPVYKRVTEQVMVRPEIRSSVVVPAVFEEREVEIEVEAERTVLERCRVSTARRSSETPVQPLCSRLVPARTQTVKRKILVQPETTREVVEPAVYKEVSRWVIETPARAVPVDIPPRTAKLRVQEVATPEQIDEQQLPPEIQHLIATRYEGQPSVVFRRAVCDTDLTPALVESLQEALRKAGFDPGPMDGKFGKRTHHALLDYQRQNGLAHGALTYESLEHLGVPANR